MSLADALENLQPGVGETEAYITPADLSAALTEIYTTAPGTVAPPVTFGSFAATSTATIAANTWAVIAWNETVETYGGLSIVSSSRITTTLAGVYHVEAAATWTGSSVGVRQLQLRKSSAGSAVSGVGLRSVNFGAPSGGYGVSHLSWDMRLAAGDYIELFRFQNTAGALAPVNNDGATPRPAVVTLRWVGL